MKKLFLIGILILNSNAFANSDISQSDKGNGGDVVVCKNANGKIISAVLLDYYEAKAMRGIDINLGDESSSNQDKVNLALNRLSRFDKKLSDIYMEYSKSFMSEARFLTDTELVDIPDSEHVIFPKGCSVEQAVIQRTPEFVEDARYIVNKDIWDRLSSSNQTGLILHEVIYRDAIQKGAKNSAGVRYFNSIISSKVFESWAFGKYYSMLDKIGIQPGDGVIIYRDFALGINTLQFYPNGEIKGGEVSDSLIPGTDNIFGGLIKRWGVSFGYVTGQIVFDKNGKVLSANITSPYSGYTNIPVIKDGPTIGCAFFGYIEFYPNTQNLKSCLLLDPDRDRAEDYVPSYQVQGKTLKLISVHNEWKGRERVEFYESGSLKKAILKEPTELLNQNGDLKLYKGTIRLDANERVID